MPFLIESVAGWSQVGPAFLSGLFAGGLSCAAVQGGLLAGLLTRQRRAAAAAGGPAVPQGGAEGYTQDLVPVSGFIAGKFVSHVILGALLGTLGAAMRLGYQTQVTMAFVAAALVVVFGLAQLGVPGFRRIVIEPPASWLKVVRAQTKSQDALAPGLLGLATVLVPCGVTVSMMALAMTSGSALIGAGIMGAFVLGTAPLFTVLGFLVRHLQARFAQSFAIATGVVLLIVGGWLFNNALAMSGSAYALGSSSPATVRDLPDVGLAQAVTPDVEAAGGAEAAPGSESGAGTQQGNGGNAGAEGGTGTDANAEVQEILITVQDTSYSPEVAEAKAGVPTVLIFRTNGVTSCARDIMIPALNLIQLLPETGDTRIEIGTSKAGTFAYSCSMGMYRASIEFS